MLYPIGIQSFETIRKAGYVYVDKTEFVYRLATTGKFFFLSRPRRFGKSLLISTLDAYFRGRKDLFSGLYIDGRERAWAEYPVLRFDLSGKTYHAAGDLSEMLDMFLGTYEKEYAIEKKYDSPELRFQGIVDSAFEKTGKPVVVLIDEYDKPLLDNISDDDVMEPIRSLLSGFYGVLKAKNDKIHFAFLTGVTKMGKLSVFSTLNNLTDISQNPAFSGICGITGKELHQYFTGGVTELAEANAIPVEDCFEKLALLYDGYHFCENTPGVYNPFSLLNALFSGKFQEYWFATGTPSFLVKMLKAGDYKLPDLNSIRVPSSMLGGVNVDYPDVITLLYQAGYLTIKGYDADTDLYVLGYPNKEVENGFVNSLSPYFTRPLTQVQSDFSVEKFADDIRNGNAEMLMKRFQAFFADMDYQIQGKTEYYFQNTLYVMAKLLGQRVDVEHHTASGRVDLLIQTPRYVYIMELKRDRDVKDALDQIDERHYDWPYLAGDRKVFKIGASFSSATRQLTDWSVR